MPEIVGATTGLLARAALHTAVQLNSLLPDGNTTKLNTNVIA